MSKDFEISSELTELEVRLRLLAVGASKLDRDQLMYQAGWAAALAGPRTAVPLAALRGWNWPAATAVMTTVAAVLGLLLFQQPTWNQPATVIGITPTVSQTEPQVENHKNWSPQIAEQTGGGSKSDLAGPEAADRDVLPRRQQRTLVDLLLGTQQLFAAPANSFASNRSRNARILRALDERAYMEMNNNRIASASAGARGGIANYSKASTSAELMRELLPDIDAKSKAGSHPNEAQPMKKNKRPSQIKSGLLENGERSHETLP